MVVSSNLALKNKGMSFTFSPNSSRMVQALLKISKRKSRPFKRELPELLIKLKQTFKKTPAMSKLALMI